MHYLEMTDPNQGADIQGQFVARSRLGVHLQLGRLLQFIHQSLEAENAGAAAGGLEQYFKLAGFDMTGKSGLEQLQAFLELVELNRSQVVLAWQRGTMPSEDKPPPYDYPGRGWAWWVHKLATRYGWSKEQIFKLWPEEAAAYLQEIMVSDYDEADERRSLSELSYHYDKVSQKSSFRPIPRPAWMQEAEADKPKLRRIRRDMLPMGNIINLTNKTDADFEIIH